MIEDRILNNLKLLIEEGNNLKDGDKRGHVKSDSHMQSCHAWIASAEHTVQLIFPNPSDSYRSSFLKISTDIPGYIVNQLVGSLTSVLQYVLRDIDNGLLSSFADNIRAELFDDFLDHADEYFKNNMKNEAGVIAGVVFEDSIRKLAEKKSIPQTGINIDQLISGLASKSIISATKAKRYRVAAHVRTKATHAQWSDFELSDVDETIKLTRELLVNYLDN